MKRLAILACCVPAAAWAHPGHHAFDSIVAYVAHLLGEPDHVALLAGTVLLCVWAVRAGLRRRAKQADQSSSNV